MPKCVVIDPSFDWEDDDWCGRARRCNETVIYEVHVKGFTKRRAGVREDLRGTYGGLASADAIAYLKSLGVTAVELLPVHHIVDEGFLARPRPDELLGLLDASATSRRTRCTPRPATRCASSRAW